MSDKQVNFSANDVNEITFRQSFRGYHVEDVDYFVEKVMEDYATFTKEIAELKNDIDNLKKGYR